MISTAFTLRRIQELVRFGEAINAKVTAAFIPALSQMVVHVQDLEFKDYISAVLHLQYIQQSQIPQEHHKYLVA
jgi:hypothetical protein